jgi:hypothetical protein
VGDAAGLELDDRRQPHADRDGRVRAQVPDQLDQLAHERVGVRDVGLDELLRRQLAVLERRRSDLRASDVEADELAVHYSLAAAASSR